MEKTFEGNKNSQPPPPKKKKKLRSSQLKSNNENHMYGTLALSMKNN